MKGRDRTVLERRHNMEDGKVNEGSDGPVVRFAHPDSFLDPPGDEVVAKLNQLLEIFPETRPRVNLWTMCVLVQPFQQDKTFKIKQETTN